MEKDIRPAAEQAPKPYDGEDVFLWVLEQAAKAEEIELLHEAEKAAVAKPRRNSI